ncbi:GTPase HflX [Candidatus Gracilibacteria bacterium]|nr:GTPase HflX [Candidatus Gracilibacteria bacterium]
MSKNLRELEQLQSNLEYQNNELRVFIADILPIENRNEVDMQDRLEEVENLVNTYGGIVILKHIQKRGTPDYKNYIGTGKIDEIISEMKENNANLLILGNILKPIQIHNINEKLKEIGAKAWDRVDLILKIFEKNAKTDESRLQIELASIKHMGPRIFGMSEELGSQGSGGNKGSRGKGETNTEIMKRHLLKREEFIKQELKKFEKTRKEHRKSREKKGLKTVGIVGYTNAGKSSLMNILTQKGVLAENKLFATLGTSVGKMYIENSYDKNGIFIPKKDILVNDTIGFIRDLPPSLIASFSSTLEDSIEANILLHVIDASDPKIEEKIEVVEEVLKKINATQDKIYVFNKIDLISDEKLLELKEKFIDLSPVFISTYKNKNIDKLKEIIIKKI